MQLHSPVGIIVIFNMKEKKTDARHGKYQWDRPHRHSGWQAQPASEAEPPQVQGALALNTKSTGKEPSSYFDFGSAPTQILLVRF